MQKGLLVFPPRDCSPNRQTKAGALSDARQIPTIVRFGSFAVDLRSGELRKGGIKIRLQEQPFKVLSALLEKPGEIVTRDELRQRIWPEDSFGDFDHAVNIAVAKLRAALSDSAEKPRLIETLPRRGYRFIGVVEPTSEGTAPRKTGPMADSLETVARPGTQPVAWPTYRLIAVTVLGLAFVAVIVFSLDAGGVRRKVFGTSSRAPAIRSLAVLPLENLSGDPSQEYFADGMTDELITDLAQIHSLRVISRTSVVQFKRTQKKLPDIAAELNVDAVVEGSVSRTGNHVRVTAQLLDARRDTHLWAASYDREMSDIVALQGQVAKSIAEQVNASISPLEGEMLSARRYVNPEAYDALLTARYLFNHRNAADTQRAIEYLRRAVELDPNNAPAWSTLAYCYTSLGADLGVADPKTVLPLARSAIDHALQIDPNLAEAHLTLAWIKLWYDWDWSGSEAEFRRALELNPNDSATHREYSHLLQVQKRFDESIAENRRAIDLAPLDILASIHLAWTYADAHDGVRAVEQSKHVLEMDPTFTGAFLFEGTGYQEQGKWSEAIAAYERAQAAYPGAYRVSLAYAYAASGDKPRAQAALASLIEFSRDHYVSPDSFAACYAVRGEKDRAFEWLEKAYKERATGMVELSVTGGFASLRGDPRFTELLRRMRLPN